MTQQRRFVLVRDQDETGISGIGVVVEGVQFSDGHVAYRWMTAWATNQQADSMEIVEKVHGHGGKTRIVWLDPPEEADLEASYLPRIITLLTEQGGGFGLIYHREAGEWSTNLEFGQEAPDSPIVGGAAYGVSNLPGDAIEQILKQAGI